MRTRRTRLPEPGRIVAFLALLLSATAPLDAEAAAQWYSLPAAPFSIRIDDLHFLDANLGWIATGEGRIFRTTNGGASFDLQFDDPTIYFRCIRFADRQRGWAGTLRSTRLMYATTDGGATWTLVPNIPEPRPNALCGLSVASSQVIYGVGSYAGPARVVKTTDGGATWTSTDVAPLATTLVDVYFKSELEGLAVGGLGTFADSTRSVVLRTTDGGATWQQRFLGTRRAEWCWKISFPTPSIGYVSLERPEGDMYFLRTTDGGVTWTEHPYTPNFNEQGIGFVTPDVGWIGSDIAMYGTTDGGATWTPASWGDYLNRFQFLTPTLGYGSGVSVYKYFDPLVDVPTARPTKLQSRAAPNPFVSNTTIRFTLDQPERVELYVADPAGRIVRRLETGTRPAGSYTLVWDGKDDRGVPTRAGIYLYVLHAGEWHDMGKLVRVP